MITIQEYLITKHTKAKTVIKATDETIYDIVHHELKQNGIDADLNHIDVSAVTNMRGLFRLTRFKGDVSEWNVENVNNMEQMFTGCSEFNCDLGSWDVSKVTSFERMFALCTQFKGNGLKKWKIGNADSMQGMFISCKNFDEDISNWDVQYVRDFRVMFKYCESFNRDLSKWQVYKYAQCADMFFQCPIARREKFKPQRV